MALKDEIMQSAFQDPHSEAIVNIFFTGYWLDRLISFLLKPYDISHEQYNILRILKGGHPAAYCLQDVQRRMLNRTSNATRLVEKLRKKGLVSRRSSKTNRRKVDIRITNQGLQVLVDLDRAVGTMTPYLKQAISPEEARSLSDMLDKLRHNFDTLSNGCIENSQGEQYGENDRSTTGDDGPTTLD